MSVFLLARMRFCVLCAVLSTTLVSPSLAGDLEKDFWQQDVWQEEERPFLFYGTNEKDEQREAGSLEPKKKESEAQPEEKDAPDEPATKSPPQQESDSTNASEKTLLEQELTSFQSLPLLKRAVAARLEAAVMHPSEPNLARYLEANVFLLNKAGVFAQAWRSSIVANPQWDWTAQHPSANFASTELSRVEDLEREKLLQSLSSHWGLILIGDDGNLTRLMTPIVERFSKAYGLELVELTRALPNPHMPQAKPVGEIAKHLTPTGVTLLPALVLVHEKDSNPQKARLVATGVTDLTEIGRRVAALVREREASMLPSSVVPATLNKEIKP